MLVSADCFAAIGPMDESFFLYSEETELMLRASDAGWSTRYVPEARAVHVGGDLTRSPALWSLRTLNRIRLHRRRHGRGPAAAFLGASLVREGVRASVGKATSRQALRDLLRRGPGIVLGPRASRAPQAATPGWICFSAQDWWYFNRAHSDFQLMQPIARRRPVLLVNSIGLRVPLPGRSTSPLKRVVRKAKSVGRFVRTPVPGLPGYHVMSPLPLPLYGSPAARRIGTLLVRAQVWLVARSLGIIGPGRPDPVIAVTIPTAIGAARSLPHSALVVNRSDKYSSFAEADTASIRALEMECLAEADLVFYSANALREAEASFTGDRSRSLDHGVDTDLFHPSSEPLPADLVAIPGPRIGYFGAIRDHLVDIDLLEQVARGLPDASLVLVGPVVCPKERMASLRSLPNVHVLGPRPHDEVPGYGRGFDVALMPWNDNEWIEHANPIKMKEYLALGLPVVSTDFPEVRRYRDLIRIAGDREGFVRAVSETLGDGGLATPAERVAAVASATWEVAAQTMRSAAESARSEDDSVEKKRAYTVRSTTLRGLRSGSAGQT
jgi:glycosyltransferase involved in cell wall biosynthesis